MPLNKMLLKTEKYPLTVCIHSAFFQFEISYINFICKNNDIVTHDRAVLPLLMSLNKNKQMLTQKLL